MSGFPLAVAALNRAGLGPLQADISTDELRRAGLAAMGEVAVRLGLEDSYVVFGHTHRAGPLPGDIAAEWRPGPRARRPASGARLVNAGCWTYAPVFLTSAPAESPYWPGACVLVEDSGPPLIERMLLDRSHAELRAQAGPGPLKYHARREAGRLALHPGRALAARARPRCGAHARSAGTRPGA